MNASLLYLILTLSQQAGLDPNIVLSMIRVESNFDDKRVGTLGELGYLQMRPEYFDDHSIEAAVRELAAVKKRCSHKEENTWVICWNLGVRGASRIKNPKLQSYYQRVMEAYEKQVAISE